jgi:anionic cell wall polymer biosynthesis LytR-Cps2A-Psr (LCP) family protein
LVVTVLVLLLLPLSAALATTARLVHEVGHVPVATVSLSADGGMARGVDGSATLLLLGTHGPGAAGTWVPDSRRVVSAMVVHLDADRRAAAIVALPLAARLGAPRGRPDTLDNALQQGSATTAMAAVERLIGTRIDHLAVVDWTAFATLMDRVGGLQVDVDGAEAGLPSRTAGLQGLYLDGASMLDFAIDPPGVRASAALHRQLIVVDEVMRASLHQSLHKQPVRVYRLLDVLATNLVVDEGWSTVAMVKLALSVWSLRSAGIVYATAPMRAPSDPTFWAAVRDDGISGWLSSHTGGERANAARWR